MYMLAVGYDSLSRRMKLCGSSLNSRNFHCAKSVYRRPLIFEGLLRYSCKHSQGRFVAVRL